MKCSKCGHTWLPDVNTLSPACPRCQGLSKAENLSEALWLIFQIHGPAFIRDEQKLLAVFADVAPELKKERNQLELFVKVHGPSKLITDPSDHGIQIVIRDLRDNFGMYDASAETLCRTYLAALQGKTYTAACKQEPDQPAPGQSDLPDHSGPTKVDPPEAKPAKKTKINPKLIIGSAALLLIGSLLGELVVGQSEKDASSSDQNTQQPPAVSTPVEETPDETDTRHPTLDSLDISKDFPDVMDYEEAIHLIPDSMQTFRIERIPASDLSGIFVTPEESGMYHFDCGYLEADSSPATLEVSYDLSDVDDDASIVNGHYSVPVSIENFAFSRYFYLEKGHTYYLVLDTLQSSGEGFYTVMFSQVTNLMEGFQYMDGFHYPGQKNYYEVIASEEGDYAFSLINDMSSELDMSAWVFIDDTGSTEYLFQDVTENTVHLKAEQKIMLVCTDPGIGGGLSYNLCIEKTN